MTCVKTGNYFSLCLTISKFNDAHEKTILIRQSDTNLVLLWQRLIQFVHHCHHFLTVQHDLSLQNKNVRASLSSFCGC